MRAKFEKIVQNLHLDNAKCFILTRSLRARARVYVVLVCNKIVHFFRVLQFSIIYVGIIRRHGYNAYQVESQRKM